MQSVYSTALSDWTVLEGSKFGYIRRKVGYSHKILVFMLVFLCWSSFMNYSSYVRIRDVALKICQRRWTIGKSGERGSGISVLVARHDDDDDNLHKILKIGVWTLVSSNKIYELENVTLTDIHLKTNRLLRSGYRFKYCSWHDGKSNLLWRDILGKAFSFILVLVYIYGDLFVFRRVIIYLAILNSFYDLFILLCSSLFCFVFLSFRFYLFIIVL